MKNHLIFWFNLFGIQFWTIWLLCYLGGVFVYAQDLSCEYRKGLLRAYWTAEVDTTQEIFQDRILNLQNNLQGAKIYSKYPNHLIPENKSLANLTRLVEIQLIDTIPIPVALQHCLKSRLFEWVEPAYVYHSFWNPNDSLFSSQDALARIQMPAAWDITTGDSNQVIALVDLGFQLTHPDLLGKFNINPLEVIDGLDNDQDGFIDNVLGWDFGDSDGDVSYGNGNINIHHGTWVAGIAGATTNNGIGIAGVAPNAKLLPIKVCSDQSPAVSFGYEGIIYAADHGATVINASWGGPCNSEFGKIAVRYATQNKGCVVVAAAGNDNARKANYPAAYPEVISVASVDGSDIRCASSAYHPTIDLTAPGNIATTQYPSTYRFHGCATSYAAPIVSGVAALLRSRYPSESNEQITARIINTTDNTNALNAGFLNQLGSGRLNALQALQNQGIGTAIQGIMLSPRQPMIGDTITISFQLKNLFTTLNQVAIKLTPEISGYLSALNDSIFVGNMLAGQQVSVSGFQFIVLPSCPINARLYCFAKIISGSFSQQIPIEIMANTSYADLQGLGLNVSIDRRGKFGYPDFPPDFSVGKGLQLRNLCSSIYEGGALFRTFPNNVANNIRNDFYLLDNDLNYTQQPQFVAPTLGNTALQVGFDDLFAPIPANIQISQEWIAFSDSTLFGTGLVIMRIQNANTTNLDSQYVGLFADWDVGDFYNQNRANYDPACRLAYAYPYDTTRFPLWVGMVSLDDSLPANCYSEESSSSFNFSRQDKNTAISSGLNHTSVGLSGTGTDIYQFLSVGPFSLLANATRKIAFGFVSGKSFAELQQNCTKLHHLYQCYSFKAEWTLSDTIINILDTLKAVSNTNASSFLWDFGDGTTSSGNQAQHIYNQSGNYLLRLIANSGNCQDTLERHITILPTTATSVTQHQVIQVITKPENLVFKGLSQGTSVTIVSPHGKIIYQGNVDKDELQIQLPSGIYGYVAIFPNNLIAKTGKVFIPFLR
ncbi:MAG: S8 family serine peptidase [Bacteroidia bacterium]|nr:S8 family serine peptidase [Bacteroidia bacterium]